MLTCDKPFRPNTMVVSLVFVQIFLQLYLTSNQQLNPYYRQTFQGLQHEMSSLGSPQGTGKSIPNNLGVTASDKSDPNRIPKSAGFVVSS